MIIFKHLSILIPVAGILLVSAAMLNYRYVVLCPAEGSGGSRPSDKGSGGGCGYVIYINKHDHPPSLI